MSMYLTRAAYLDLIREDIVWLMKMPATLEREHILTALLLHSALYEGGGDFKAHKAERLDP